MLAAVLQVEFVSIVRFRPSLQNDIAALVQNCVVVVHARVLNRVATSKNVSLNNGSHVP